MTNGYLTTWSTLWWKTNLALEAVFLVNLLPADMRVHFFAPPSHASVKLSNGGIDSPRLTATTRSCPRGLPGSPSPRGSTTFLECLRWKVCPPKTLSECVASSTRGAHA